MKLTDCVNHLPEDSVGILPVTEANPADEEIVDDLTTDGDVTAEWLQTTTDGVATGWYA